MKPFPYIHDNYQNFNLISKVIFLIKLSVFYKASFPRSPVRILTTSSAS